MFGITEHHEGLNFQVPLSPKKIPYPADIDEPWDVPRNLSPLKWLSNREKQRSKLKDESVLVELVWAARDPGNFATPHSRHQLRQHLGLAPKASQEPKTECVIEGIGEMALSDESNQNLSEDSEDDEVFGPETLPFWAGADSADDSDQSPRPDEAQQPPGPSQKALQTRASEAPSLEREASSTSLLDSRLKRRRKAADEKSLLLRNRLGKRSSKTVYTPRKTSSELLDVLPVTRISNYVFMMRNCVLKTTSLLHHLLWQTLGTQLYRDATALMSIYLSTFGRKHTPSFVNLHHYRLIRRFFRATPEGFLSDAYVDILRDSFGTPIYLNHDLLNELVSVYCARHEPSEMLVYLKDLASNLHQKAAFDQVKGTMHYCTAIALYAEVLLKAGSFTRFVPLNRMPLDRLDQLKAEMELSLIASWKARQTLPTVVLRMFLYLHYPHKLNYVLSLLEDQLTIDPYQLDALEMKLVLLLRICNAQTSGLSLSDHVFREKHREDLKATVYFYVNSSRQFGSDSLWLIGSALSCFASLRDRLCVLFLCLESDLFSASLWKQCISVIFIDGWEAVQGSPGELWAFVHEAVVDKYIWQKTFFVPGCSLLSSERMPDVAKIFPYLLVVFIITDHTTFLRITDDVAQNYFSGNHLLHPGAANCTSPSASEEESRLERFCREQHISDWSFSIVTRFAHIYTWVYLVQQSCFQLTPQTPARCAEYSLHLNELLLRVEVAHRLV